MLQKKWWALLWWAGLSPRPQLTANIVSTNPSPADIGPGRVIVVGGKGYQKWAYFRCPCGCRETIMLSLNKTTRPRWAVNIDKRGRPTITPSIRQTAGCLSHFWIRNGVIDWCRDTGRPWSSGNWDNE
ncbi:MAG: DUF6527 family protein [Alphaproteobacteria bacterium]|nr:DUF6527 family protein [Alphaproteobacteria bacterium]